MPKDIAYGITKKPGQKRPTQEQAIKAKQVRYFGLKKIIREEIDKIKNKPDLQKEIVKQKKLYITAQGIIKKKETLRSQLENPKRTKKEKKEAQKQLDLLAKKATKLKKQIEEQDKLVDAIKKEEGN